MVIDISRAAAGAWWDWAAAAVAARAVRAVRTCCTCLHACIAVGSWLAGRAVGASAGAVCVPPQSASLQAEQQMPICHPSEVTEAQLKQFLSNITTKRATDNITACGVKLWPSRCRAVLATNLRQKLASCCCVQRFEVTPSYSPCNRHCLQPQVRAAGTPQVCKWHSPRDVQNHSVSASETCHVALRQPQWQLMQQDEARTVHAVDPLTFVYVLMGQLWHRDELPAATAVLKVPTAHKVQLAVPVLLANAPAGQGRHAVCIAWSNMRTFVTWSQLTCQDASSASEHTAAQQHAVPVARVSCAVTSVLCHGCAAKVTHTTALGEHRLCSIYGCARQAHTLQA